MSDKLAYLATLGDTPASAMESITKIDAVGDWNWLCTRGTALPRSRSGAGLARSPSGPGPWLGWHPAGRGTAMTARLVIMDSLAGKNLAGEPEAELG